MMKMNLPPGFFRSFAFENWPGFSQKAFAYLKKQAAKKNSCISKKSNFCI